VYLILQDRFDIVAFTFLSVCRSAEQHLPDPVWVSPQVSTTDYRDGSLIAD